MRQREVLALRIEDSHQGYITVAHSWDSRYEGFVFSTDGGLRPIYYKDITRSLYSAMERIGITDEERHRRHLNFHGWRHFFNSTMRGKIPDAILRQLTGHSTEEMTEHYSHFRLEDFKPIVAVEEGLGMQKNLPLSHRTGFNSAILAVLQVADLWVSMGGEDSDGGHSGVVECWQRKEEQMDLVDNSDWLLFLSLEKDFAATIDYVAIDPKHDDVFSIVYLKILLATCSAVERLAKKYCGMSLSKGTEIRAAEIGKSLVKKNPNFPRSECRISQYPKWDKIVPWQALAGEQIPSWWSAYNDSKHGAETFTSATQKNVIESLAALYCLNYYPELERQRKTVPNVKLVMCGALFSPSKSLLYSGG